MARTAAKNKALQKVEEEAVMAALLVLRKKCREVLRELLEEEEAEVELAARRIGEDLGKGAPGNPQDAAAARFVASSEDGGSIATPPWKPLTPSARKVPCG